MAFRTLLAAYFLSHAWAKVYQGLEMANLQDGFVMVLDSVLKEDF